LIYVIINVRQHISVFLRCAVIDPGYGWIRWGGHRPRSDIHILVIGRSAAPRWPAAHRRRIGNHLESNPSPGEDHHCGTERQLRGQR